jgi:hypothetical protein
LDDLCRESLIIYHIYYIYHIFGVCICWYSLKFNKALFMLDMTAQAKCAAHWPKEGLFLPIGLGFDILDDEGEAEDGERHGGQGSRAKPAGY